MSHAVCVAIVKMSRIHCRCYSLPVLSFIHVALDIVPHYLGLYVI